MDGRAPGTLTGTQSGRISTAPDAGGSAPDAVVATAPAPRRPLRYAAVILAGATMAAVAVLLFWDAVPRAFPSRAHTVLGAAPLALIAVSAVVYQIAHRPRRYDLLRTAILAAAFLFWAGNQLRPDAVIATLLNDLAIALFVLDVFLTIVRQKAK